MTISFIWQGITERFSHWNDGLRAAMKLIEQDHTVYYLEPWEPPRGDIILYWESPCTANGRNADYYNRIRQLNKPKALLFAGGPIEPKNCEGFDLFFVESEINAQEFAALNMPYKKAFGVNTDIFKPLNLEKKWDGIHQGTSASWKRQWLLAEALKDKSLIVGRYQLEDPEPFDRSKRAGADVFDEVPYDEVNKLLNQSHVMVQTSDYWGGGQRATLEALAAGIPVVCMSDSPKNREYIEESRAGLVTIPEPDAIKDAVYQIINEWTPEEKRRGVDYVHSKYTHTHYATNLLEGIHAIIGV